MRTKFIIAAVAAFVVCLGSSVVFGQKRKLAPPYKITKITILPFDQQTGLFEKEFTGHDSRAFWNDLSIAFLMTVEVTGQRGSFEPARHVSITVTEGKKIKTQRSEVPGVLSDTGKYYIPVWLYTSMCNTVTITARITGQRTTSVMKREVPMACGE